jgi:sugar lactone lactonase YvrE
MGRMRLLSFTVLVAIGVTAAHATSVTVGSVTGECGTTASVGVSIIGTSPAEEIQFTVEYDQAKLAFLTMQPGGVASDWYVAPGNQSGAVRIRLRPPAPATVGGPVGSLVFKVPSTARTGSAEVKITGVQSLAAGGTIAGTGGTGTVRFACLSAPVVLPPAPVVTAKARSHSSIAIDWSKVEGATKYKVHRGSFQIYEGPWTRIYDDGLAPGTQYCYSARSIAATGESRESASSCATTASSCTPPVAAPGITALAGGTSAVLVSWAEVPNAGSYRLYRDGAKVFEGNRLAFSDEGRSAGGTYCYSVEATSDCGTGARSVETCATTAQSCSPPPAPTAVSSLAVASSSVSLSWAAVTGATVYQVTRNGVTVYLDPRASLADVLLSPNTSYCYEIVAINDCGASPPVTTCAATAENPSHQHNFTRLAGSTTGPGSTDGLGTLARFALPRSVAVDAAGNAYVADTFNHTIRKVTPSGIVTTLAGSPGQKGSDDGVGSAARFNSPIGIAADGAGTVYVADTHNATIRRITPAGVVSTIAGAPGEAGSADGPATAARFSRPEGVTVDGSGNVYVADTYNATIRRITPAGIVSTLAGTAGERGMTDGTGAAARFSRPRSVAADANGNLFVADTSSHTIRRVSPAGDVTTFAGEAGRSGSSDGTGVAAHFHSPAGVAVDGAGFVYVADGYWDTESGNNTIRRITPSGTVSTLAGLAGALGYDDGVGSAARFERPSGLAVDGEGYVFVADTFNSTLRLVSPAGVVTTLAGASGREGSADGSGAAARFSEVAGIAIDGSGNLYAADKDNHTIRKVTPDGTVTTLAGAAGQTGSSDGPGPDARFNVPRGVAVDAAGNVYVTDRENHTIRRITPAGVVSTLAGMAGHAGSADGTGSSARFDLPNGIAVDSSGNLFVVEYASATIRRITPAGVVTTFAGLAGARGSADGTGSAARFDRPRGITIDAAGNLYVADYGNHTIRKVTPSAVVTTVAGVAGEAGSCDGPVATAHFNLPFGVTVDADGNLYVADTYNFTIRKISSSGDVTTFAGAPGQAGTSTGTGASARFVFPQDVVAGRDGRLFVADSYSIVRGSMCRSDSLCLDGDHFSLALSVKDPRQGTTGAGLPIPQNDLFGYFSVPDLTGNPDNPEVFVKLLDGRPVNGRYWVFYGGLTDLEYSLAVTNDRTGHVVSYRKEPYGFCGGADTSAFEEALHAPVIDDSLRHVRMAAASGERSTAHVGERAQTACASDELCFNGARFVVKLTATDPRTGSRGEGLSIPQSDLFGYFALPGLTGNPENPEVFVKLLDGRQVNGRFWVFYGGLTDFGYTLTVTDRQTGATRTYEKAPYLLCGGADTGAF